MFYTRAMDRSGPTTEELKVLLLAVGGASPAADDAERIDRLRLFEELKAACEAAQAAEAVAFDRSQRAVQAVAGVPSARQGRGVASQVGLALRVSPFRAQRWLGWAKIVTSELPATYAELAAGRVSAWKTMLVARETAVLSREDRAAVDTELAPKLAGWGDRRVEGAARQTAYRLDPHAAVERARVAESERHVSIRPVPDTMVRLSAVLPVARGVACYAALAKAADTTVAAGDTRGRGQIMADTLVERVTGQASADAVPVEVELVMSDETLLGGPEPALIPGYGPVPAGVARDLALGRDGQADADNFAHANRNAGAEAAPRWLRRLFRHPATGQLAAMETPRREFTADQRRYLRLRDQTCRTPYCDAPVRHADHVIAHIDGGPTAVTNGQGNCEACNHAKQARGWTARTEPDDTVITRTPTGHQYRSELPDPPRAATPRPRSPVEQRAPARSPVEHHLRGLVDLYWAA